MQTIIERLKMPNNNNVWFELPGKEIHREAGKNINIRYPQLVLYMASDETLKMKWPSFDAKHLLQQTRQSGFHNKCKFLHFISPNMCTSYVKAKEPIMIACPNEKVERTCHMEG